MQKDLVTMSIRELNRLEVIQKVADGLLKQGQAGDLLGISTRQIKRLVKGYREEGAKSLGSKRRGKKGNRGHSQHFKNQIMDLVSKQYADFGPTFAAEKLFERDGCKINKETLRQWMIESKLWKGKKRKTGIIHQRRNRRPCLGELVQIDGSHHDWFEGRSEKCCLLVFIDDATSRLLELRFEKQETTLGYFNGTRSYIKKHGRPDAFYSDKHGVFRVNAVEAESGTGETQFGRAIRELGIKIIFANTPQAKGRVERANETLQDRLVKELRLKNISDIETANAFLPQYMLEHNARFSVEAANPTDLHRKEVPTETQLNLIFTHQEQRIISKNLEISYRNIIYQIKTATQGYQLRKASITVCDDQQGNIILLYKGKVLEYSTLDKKNRVTDAVGRKELQQASKFDGRAKGHKPKAGHPWKQYHDDKVNGVGLSTALTSLTSI